MPIFKDNYFTNDSYSLRLSRLEILKNYINYWAKPLSIPEPLIEWGISAFEKWQEATKAVKANKGKTNEVHLALKKTDEETFEYYLKCKRLILSQFSQNENKLKSYGVTGRFPRNRADKMKAVETMIRANQQMMERGDSEVLPQEFISNLKLLLDASNKAFEKVHSIDQTESHQAVTKQIKLFKEDSKKLRMLYAWALMTWSPEEPYIVQLGFAVKSKKFEQKEEEVEEEI
ncbi:MAG: hypothetical protein KAU01_02030 [Candidatus Cloacimonetes bacterium]|nr:hypothetical protein [Candidatus Cloacimonadota bacterium]